MAMFRDPLRRTVYLRMNDNYDQQDIIVENELSRKKVFQDLPTNEYLTEGGKNSTILMSPFIVKDEARDVVVNNPPVVGRLERYRPTDRPGRHHTRKYY